MEDKKMVRLHCYSTNDGVYNLLVKESDLVKLDDALEFAEYLSENGIYICSDKNPEPIESVKGARTAVSLWMKDKLAVKEAKRS